MCCLGFYLSGHSGPSYRSAAAASDPGAVAALAESRKMSKYSALDSTLYRFFLLLSKLWVPLGPDHSISSKITTDHDQVEEGNTL